MKPVKIYAEYVDKDTMGQFNRAMNHPCVTQGALMPDAHLGYTVPIGSVIKSKDAIFPAMVGYDIGCGVAATKLNIGKEGLDLEKIKEGILKRIPIGFNRHKKNKNIEIDYPEIPLGAEFLSDLADVGRKQIGTLGGGNHFIEIGESGQDGNLWIVIHSGSRGLGHKTASRHMRIAYDKHNHIKYFDGFDRKDFEIRNEQFKANAPEKYEKVLEEFLVKKETEYNNRPVDIEGLYFIPYHSEEARNYIAEMGYCILYAMENRFTMTNVIVELIREQKDCVITDTINQNHNHAEVVGEGEVIHRKGATHADNGMMGVIPGNMIDGSFIVRGKGNKESLNSSSHGAGRVMSRAQAHRQLDKDKFLDEVSHIVSNATEKTLDESPRAYKNIFDVMKMQKDMVDVLDRAIPILNVKG